MMPQIKMKDTTKPISKTIHENMMEMKCCDVEIKYDHRVDEKIKGAIDTYWCPKCGFSFTITVGYLDNDEMPN
jgi:hypothetical protein